MEVKLLNVSEPQQIPHFLKPRRPNNKEPLTEDSLVAILRIPRIEKIA